MELPSLLLLCVLLIQGQASLELFSFYVESRRKGTPREVRSNFVYLFRAQMSGLRTVKDAFIAPSPVSISTLLLGAIQLCKGMAVRLCEQGQDERRQSHDLLRVWMHEV